jgi:hypothetical protein
VADPPARPRRGHTPPARPPPTRQAPLGTRNYPQSQTGTEAPPPGTVSSRGRSVRPLPYQVSSSASVICRVAGQSRFAWSVSDRQRPFRTAGSGTGVARPGMGGPCDPPSTMARKRAPATHASHITRVKRRRCLLLPRTAGQRLVGATSYLVRSSVTLMPGPATRMVTRRQPDGTTVASSWPGSGRRNRLVCGVGLADAVLRGCGRFVV